MSGGSYPQFDEVAGLEVPKTLVFLVFLYGPEVCWNKRKIGVSQYSSNVIDRLSY